MTTGTELRKRGLWLLKPFTRRLIGFLNHADSHLRSEGARALGHIGDVEAVAPLVEALSRIKQDDQLPLALAQIGDESALQPLLQAFNDADREARPNIALALGAFNSPDSVKNLVQALRDPDSNVRFNSISALAKIKPPSSVSPLIAALSESNEWIFLNVVDSLSRIADHRATNPLITFYLKEHNERKRAAIVTALGCIKDLTAVPTLSKALRDTDDRVKANAVESLAAMEMPSNKLLSLIQPFLKHSNNRICGNAIVAAFKAGYPNIETHLRAMLSDSDKWIRATLGYILSVIEPPHALQMIVKLIQDEDNDVKKNAARALACKARDDQIEFLIKLLSDPTPFVRLQAVQTLGRTRAAPAITWLERLFNQERNFKIRSAIITSLGQIGDRGGVPVIQRAIGDRDSRVRANAVEALELILGEEAVPLIQALLTDPDNRTRSNAAKALFRAGDISVLSKLENMLVDNDASSRISAAYTLGQIGLALRELENSPLLVPLKSSLGTVKLKEEPTVEVKISTEPQQSVAEVPDNRLLSREELRTRFLELNGAGKLKEALDAVEDYIGKFPDDLMASFFAGNLNFQLSRFENAIGFFKKVVELDPFHVQAFSNLALSCYRVNRLQEANHYFKQALKIQPDLSVIRFNLANILLKENRWEEAIFHFEEGRRYQKPTARVLGNLGFAYQKTGQYEKALGAYSQSVAADPRDPGVYYNWSLILIRQGKKDQAKLLLNKALSDVPVGSAGLKAIRELLERLKE